MIRIDLSFFSTLDGDKDERGWTTFHHLTPPAGGLVRGWGMKTEERRGITETLTEGGLSCCTLTLPTRLSQGSAWNWAQESCKEAHRDAQRQRKIQQVWSPATTNTQAPWPLNKFFVSGEMCHLWLLLWTFVASHKSTVCFCTLWEVWKAGMCCLLFFLPTSSYVLQPRKSTAKDTMRCSALQKNQPFLWGCHCLQAVISRHHVLNPQ